MRNVQAPEKIDTWRIVCAAQSEPDLSEDRQILYYGGNEGDYHGNGPFIVLDGSYCSCYDWEEVEWYATEYTKDELLTLARSKSSGEGCYSESERRFWLCVLMAVDVDSTIALRDRTIELEKFSRMLVDYLDPAGMQGMCNIECPAYDMCAGKTCCMFEHWAQERAGELGLHGEERACD